MVGKFSSNRGRKMLGSRAEKEKRMLKSSKNVDKKTDVRKSL
jgi:hypothetical protein